MKIDKEYPATHSMATAWFCADEEGNVAIFDIEDDGPVPVGGYTQDNPNDVFWVKFSGDNNIMIKSMPLSIEQIHFMLMPYKERDVWKYKASGWTNYDLRNIIIRIDTDKLDIFEKALSYDNSYLSGAVCLSKEMGYYYVSLCYNKEGVELLEKNDVILELHKAPYYNTYWGDGDEENKSIMENNKRFPIFFYHQDYSPNCYPLLRITTPKFPMKVEQLPTDIQKKITRLPLIFNETEKIQLAELMPVEGISSIEYVYENKIWYALASMDGSEIYYNVKLNKIIRKEEMDTLLAEGKAEEYDWNKHRAIEFDKND